jgi:hypothetical protein
MRLLLSSLISLLIYLTPANADLYYDTYAGTGAYPSFPGNGGSLTYPTKLSSGTVSSINHSWGSGYVLDSGRNERVIVNFYGYLTVPGTGSQSVTFYLQADDGVYMKLDSTVVINDWQEQGAGTWNYVSTSQSLTGGQTYYIDMWWYENGGGASVKLYWNQTGSVALVPASTYSTTAPTPTSSISSAQTLKVNDARGVTHSGNGIYINQVGSNNTLNVTQDGNDNLIAGGTSTTNAIVKSDITGNNNTTTMTQRGDNNAILFDITGDYNSTTVDQGGAAGSDGNRIEFNVNGDHNVLSLTQRHNNGVGTNGHYLGLDVDGNYNNILTGQKDDGDKKAFISVQGNSNDIDLLQQGSGSHYVEIDVGSNQTVDVTQDGTGNHNASVSMTGYASGLDLTQDSSTNQTYSINQNCLTVSGCGTTTVNQQ